MLLTLPMLASNLRALRSAILYQRSALAWVFVSGVVGSSLGTVCYTAALGAGVNPTAAAMLLNLQPVISTVAGALLFRETISARFYPFAAAAVLSGVVIALPGLHDLAALHVGATEGLLLISGTILCWGFATAAGRGAMRNLPVGLAAPLRLWSGLLATGAVVLARYLAGAGGPNAAAFLGRDALINLALLSSLTGALPLFVYFAGLATTPASIARVLDVLHRVRDARGLAPPRRRALAAPDGGGRGADLFDRGAQPGAARWRREGRGQEGRVRRSLVAAALLLATAIGAGARANPDDSTMRLTSGAKEFRPISRPSPSGAGLGRPRREPEAPLIRAPIRSRSTTPATEKKEEARRCPPGPGARALPPPPGADTLAVRCNDGWLSLFPLEAVRRHPTALLTHAPSPRAAAPTR